MAAGLGAPGGRDLGAVEAAAGRVELCAKGQMRARVREAIVRPQRARYHFGIANASDPSSGAFFMLYK